MSSPGDSHFFAGEIVNSCLLRRLIRVRDRREVWRVYDRVRRCRAVLKFLPEDNSRAKKLPVLADFLLHSDCPQLARILDFFKVDGYYAVELEYALGSLSGRLAKTGPFPVAQCVFVLRELLLALDTLHRHGIVHRDIKPGNILLTPDGGVKLCDFGIAKIDSIPEEGPAVVGSPSTMSPEQTVDSTAVDGRSDFFSLASVEFELLTGKPRFPHVGFTETAKLVQVSQPDDLRRYLTPTVPDGLIRLLEWMSANDPCRRPENAGIILAELDRLQLPCERIPMD